MIEVSCGQLRTKLGQLLRQVAEERETILVTWNGTPYAMIQPIEPLQAPVEPLEPTVVEPYDRAWPSWTSTRATQGKEEPEPN